MQHTEKASGVLAYRDAQYTAYGSHRVSLSSCDQLPFEDNAFDETWHVLKLGSHFFISDLRRVLVVRMFTATFSQKQPH
jgi:hypothetical protein